jgi:hypothetical protein
MEQPEYVTEVADKRRQHPGGLRVDLCFFNDTGAIEWYRQFSRKASFTFRHGNYFNKGGSHLYSQLTEAIKKRDSKSVKTLLPKIRALCQRNYDDLKPVEKWAHSAVQLPEDIGGPRKGEIRKYLTARASGRVLETMCGFNSYFSDSPNIAEVVALDFCKEMLERYAYPERTRILYDLERIVKGKGMDFFADGSFQTIGCWGSNYLSRQTPVFAEFGRILGDDGKLLILENTSEGYSDLVKRYFDPEECAKNMQEAGFRVQIIPLPWIKLEWEYGDYFLVEGVR